MAMQNQNGHSANVVMALQVNGHALSIAQMGPDFLLLDEPTEHPAGVAQVLLSVDGHEERWAVRLPEGIRFGEKRVAVSKI
jgi:hypothetical protein